MLFFPQFVEVEGQITSLVDLYPSFLRKGYRREIFIAIVCFMSFLLGLTMVTEVGAKVKHFNQDKNLYILLNAILPKAYAMHRPPTGLDHSPG